MEPFQTQQSRDILMVFLNKEVLPNISSLRKVLLKIIKYKVERKDIIDSRKIYKIQEESLDLYEEFMKFYDKHNNPLFTKDGIFGGTLVDVSGQQGLVISMTRDYEFMRKQFDSLFVEGFRLIEGIESQILKKQESANRRRTFIISMIAILISITTLIF